MRSRQQTADSRRVYYLDLLRILASFTVIVLHVSALSFGDQCNFQWAIANIYDSMTRWCVPMFVMISGALFLDPNRNFSYKSIFTKNILHIITAFAFWSIIYAIYCHFYFKPMNTRGLISEILTGHFHLWFLYMIIGIYITIPIMRKIASDKQLSKYFLLLSFIFTFCIPSFISILDLIPSLKPISALANNLFTTFDFNIGAGFLGYFLLGHYLNCTSFSKKTENLILALGIISYLTIAGITYLIFATTSVDNKFLYSNFSPLVMFEAMAMFVWIKRLKLHEYKLSNKFAHIAKLSFGIYLAHMLVFYILESIGLTANIVSPILGIPLMSIATFITCYGLAFILSKIPYLNKYII